MCGRFTLRTNPADVARLFALFEPPTWMPRYNIAPGQVVACLQAESGQSRPRLTWRKWGLVPAWARAGKSAAPLLINARGETVAEKPAFRSAFRQRRCVLLADGFYEWQKLGTRKQPWYITRGDHQPFAMAGLWEPAAKPDADPRDASGGEGAEREESAPAETAHEPAGGRPEAEGTCAVITTTANELMAPLHDRMPVILGPSEIAAWLDPHATAEQLLAQLRPCPAADLAAVAVSPLVNHWKNDRVECTQPVRSLFD
ncbi:MAG: SOS response-associated peptidase [Planctomycetaceae bacterium]